MSLKNEQVIKKERKREPEMKIEFMELRNE